MILPCNIVMLDVILNIVVDLVIGGNFHSIMFLSELQKSDFWLFI
jgi:hypothetical protein